MPGAIWHFHDSHAAHDGICHDAHLPGVEVGHQLKEPASPGLGRP